MGSHPSLQHLLDRSTAANRGEQPTGLDSTVPPSGEQRRIAPLPWNTTGCAVTCVQHHLSWVQLLRSTKRRELTWASYGALGYELWRARSPLWWRFSERSLFSAPCGRRGRSQ